MQTNTSRPTGSLGEKQVELFGMLCNAKERQIRKVYHTSLHVNKSVDYIPNQELENKQLLYQMMTDTSTDLLDHFRRYSSSLVTSIVYG
jgi:hypothetical protein